MSQSSHVIPPPLPVELQRAVDEAPFSKPELDRHFLNVVRRTWPNPLLQAHARYAFFDEEGDVPFCQGISVGTLARIGQFAFEMRKKRDHCPDLPDHNEAP